LTTHFETIQKYHSSLEEETRTDLHHLPKQVNCISSELIASKEHFQSTAEEDLTNEKRKKDAASRSHRAS